MYARPFDPARPLACLGQKSKASRGRIREPLPAEPGQPRRIDAQHAPNGTADLCVWREPPAGRRGVQATQRRCAAGLGPALGHLWDVVYPAAETIALVVDNWSWIR